MRQRARSMSEGTAANALTILFTDIFVSGVRTTMDFRQTLILVFLMVICSTNNKVMLFEGSKMFLLVTWFNTVLRCRNLTP